MPLKICACYISMGSTFCMGELNRIASQKCVKFKSKYKFFINTVTVTSGMPSLRFKDLSI